jgi:hypothetical protein
MIHSRNPWKQARLEKSVYISLFLQAFYSLLVMLVKVRIRSPLIVLLVAGNGDAYRFPAYLLVRLESSFSIGLFVQLCLIDRKTVQWQEKLVCTGTAG